MIGIFVDYLRNSPVEFELLISVVSSQNEQICREKFTQKTLPKMKALIIKLTPNRGRDVAPFLIAFKDEALKYDYLAHIHTKKTPHDRALSGWADYLFANLISPEAIENIISHLANDENLGIVFPPIFNVVLQHAIVLTDEDRQNMCELLSKLSINFSPNSSNFIFPAGTMFWARPSAIKRLFELNLRWEDFPPEPLPSTSGTIAHALERVFAIVCEHSNFLVKNYATRQTLTNAFYENYALFMENLRLKKQLVAKTLMSQNKPNDAFECLFLGTRLFKIKRKKLDKILKFLPFKFRRIL